MDVSSDKQSIIIRFCGSNSKTSTTNLLNSMFCEVGLPVNILKDENNVTSDRNMANNEIHNKLKKFVNNDIIIITMKKIYYLFFAAVNINSLESV